MPEINNDVRTGFNKQTLFDLELDTSKRMEAILTPTNRGSGITPVNVMSNRVNTQVAQPLLNEVPSNLSLGQALLSDNSKLQLLASSVLEREENPYYKYNFGSTIETPIEQGAKFVNKKFGFDALSNNEDFYYRNDYLQSNAIARNVIYNPAKFLGRVIGQSVLKLGEGFGFLGAMLNPMNFGPNYIQSVADNGFSKYLEEKEQSFKDNVIPIYKQAGFDEKGFFSKLSDWTFWNESVADGVAFMTAQIADTFLMGNIGKVGLLGKLGATALPKLARIATGAEDLAGAAGWARRVAGEAAFEASSTYKGVKDRLTEERRNGVNQLTDDDIELQAAKQASGNFTDNLMILGASAAFENKFIFQPLKKKFLGISSTAKVKGINISNTGELSSFTPRYSTKLGKFTNYKDPSGRLQFYGKRIAGSTIAEGYWEENAQLASERMHNSKNKYGNIVSQFLGQTLDATKGNDNEASEAIGLGALIGTLGTSLVSKFTGSERRKEITERDRVVNDFNNVRNAFLSVNQIYQTNPDGTIQLDQEGNFAVDENKVNTLSSSIQDFTSRQVDIDTIQDPILRKTLKDDLLSQYTFAAIKAGIYDKVLDKFQNIPSHIDEIEGLGFDPATTENPDEYASSIKDFKDIYDQTEKSSISKPSELSIGDYYRDEQTRKTVLYQTLSQARNSRIAKELVQQAIVNSNTSPTNDSTIQEYNTLLFREAGLNQFKALKLSFYSPHIEEELKTINKRKSEIKKSVKDNENLEETPEGLLLPKGKYKSQTEAIMDLDNYKKAAELTNSENQWNFASSKLQQDHQSFTDYISQQKEIAEKDDEVDKQEETLKQEVKAETSTEQSPVTRVEDTPLQSNEILLEGNIVSEINLTPKTYKENKKEIEKRIYDTRVALSNSQLKGSSDEQLEKGRLYEQANKDLRDLGTEEDFNNRTLISEGTPEDISTPIELNPILPEGYTIITNEDDVNKGNDISSIDATRPITYATSLITSKRDSEDNSKEEETITTSNYDGVRNSFITTHLLGNEENYIFKVVKDTFPEVYVSQGITNDDGTPLSPTGEVIQVYSKDGQSISMKDFNPKVDKTLQNLPLIFSFDKNNFRKSPLYQVRKDIWKKKNPDGDADEFYEKEWEDNQKIRKLAQEGIPTTISITGISEGVTPTTKDYVPVEQRYGKFDFEISKPTAKGSDVTEPILGKTFPKGALVAKIKGNAFMVTTSKIKEFSDLSNKISQALTDEYSSEEAANTVIKDYLEQFIYQTDRKFFQVVPTSGSDTFKIEWREVQNPVKGKKREEQESTLANATIGEERMNISKKALDNQDRYVDYAFSTPIYDNEGYKAYIKPYLRTNLKRIMKDGKLSMQKVNPYFSFSIEGQSKEDVQKQNFDKIQKGLEKPSADLNKAKVYIQEQKKAQNLSEQQVDNLLAKILKLEEIPPTEDKKIEVKKEEPKKAPSLDSLLSTPKKDKSAILSGKKSSSISVETQTRFETDNYIWDNGVLRVYRDVSVPFKDNTGAQRTNTFKKDFLATSEEDKITALEELSIKYENNFPVIFIKEITGDERTLNVFGLPNGTEVYSYGEEILNPDIEELKASLDEENRNELEKLLQRFC